MDDVDLDAMAGEVDGKAALLDFLAALEADWFADRDRWENGTIPDFLSACRAWAGATSTLTGRPMVGEPPSWAAFAAILHAGKFYE